jgi:NAD(P)-dependent dehydrogenase (short-subunit alcohol dehydrogenase family)
LPDGYRALVVGASGAIGSALVRNLEGNPRCAQVLAIGRNTVPALDFDDEQSFAAAAAALKPTGPWHCIINAAGALHGAFGTPERRLDQLNYAHMQALYRINAMGPALLLANFAPMLPRREPGVFAVLSARVGSIGDNRLGGWYSYRASKAALNMIVKTASIEVARTHPLAVLVALHPGTVRSALSEPFSGATIGRPPDEAAADLLNVLEGLAPADTGNFYSYDGKRLPW